jgi:hypothetical protein
MTSRAGNWMIAVGVVVALVGLCLLPAALGEHAESSLLGLGAAVFSLGALAISAGIYLKAQALRPQAASEKPTQGENANRRPRGACDLCRQEAPVVHCKVHQFHLCAACLAEHYDFRACVYVPSTRRTESKPSKSLTAKAYGG